MLLLHVLLSFLLFSTSTAKDGKTSGPPTIKFRLGQIYWYKLEYWGAKGPGSEKTYPVIPVGPVPRELTGNVDHDLVFFAEIGEYIPLEDQYKEEAKSYFDEGATIDTKRRTVNLREYWINKGWARIGKREIMERFHHMRKGKAVTMKAKEMGVISDNMLKNLKQRLELKLLKWNFAADDLGQIFKPFIEFGYIYWLEPSYLAPGSEQGPASDIRHPIVALGRVGGSSYPGHDLIFVTQSSNYIPHLDGKYKGVSLNYFPQDKTSEAFFTGNVGLRELNIGYAQVVESGTFCFRRNGYYLGEKWKDFKHLHVTKQAVGELLSNMQKNWNERSPIKLNFELKHLGQYTTAAAPSAPKDNDFSVEKGFVYWTRFETGLGPRRALVIPVGEVPNSPNNFFVAELSSMASLSEEYWQSAKDYFPADPPPVIHTNRGNNKIDVLVQKINTKWAMAVPRSTLDRTKDETGRKVHMYEVKMGNIFNSMFANYIGRRAKGETDFSKLPALKWDVSPSLSASQPNKKGGRAQRGNDGNGKSAGAGQGDKSSKA